MKAKAAYGLWEPFLSYDVRCERPRSRPGSEVLGVSGGDVWTWGARKTHCTSAEAERSPCRVQLAQAAYGNGYESPRGCESLSGTYIDPSAP